MSAKCETNGYFLGDMTHSPVMFVAIKPDIFDEIKGQFSAMFVMI